MSTRTFPEIGDDETTVGTVDCERKSVKVFVDGIEIPTVESSKMRDDEHAVEVQVRTDGPADITRLSDIYFPSHWRGENVFDALPFDEDRNVSVPVVIQARPPQNSNVERDWTTVHSGWLRKIGSGGDGRLLRMRVSDYANIASNTPITNSWKNTDAQSVIEDVLSRLSDKANLPTVSLRTTAETPVDNRSGSEQIPITAPAAKSSLALQETITEALGISTQQKTFQAVNGDTVADVLNWVTDITDTIWFFSPISRSTIALNIIPQSQIERLFESRQTGGDVYIHKNQALYNIDPINQVTVIGERVEVDAEVADALYITATATHSTLVENAGGAINEKVVRDTFSSVEAAEKRAVKMLKETHAHSNEGEIIVDGRPEFIPFNRIEAIPICNDLVDASMSPTVYQIKEVTHEIPTEDRYTTRLNVGISTTDDDIVAVSGYGEGEGDVLYRDMETGVQELGPSGAVAVED